MAGYYRPRNSRAYELRQWLKLIVQTGTALAGLDIVLNDGEGCRKFRDGTLDLTKKVKRKFKNAKDWLSVKTDSIKSKVKDNVTIVKEEAED